MIKWSHSLLFTELKHLPGNNSNFEDHRIGKKQAIYDGMLKINGK